MRYVMAQKSDEVRSVLTLSFYDDEGRKKLKVYGGKFIWFYNKLYTQAKNI